MWVRSQLHPIWAVVNQKQRGLRGLLCRWPSITEWEMYITAQGPRLRNNLYCVEWDIKLYYTIPRPLTFAVQIDIYTYLLTYSQLCDSMVLMALRGV